MILEGVMKGWMKKTLITIAVIAAFILLCVLLSLREVETFGDKYAGVDLNQEISGMERTGTYEKYLLEHEGASTDTKDIAVDLGSFTAEGDAHMEASYEGRSQVLVTEVESVVTFTVQVPKSGFYNLNVDYLLPQSRGVAAERAVYINGALRFDETVNISFGRL